MLTKEVGGESYESIKNRTMNRSGPIRSNPIPMPDPDPYPGGGLEHEHEQCRAWVDEVEVEV